MQGLLFQQVEITRVQSQAIRVMPGHGTGKPDDAINDDVYHDETSPLRQVFYVLGNVIGGVLLLSALFVLPHVLAGFVG